MRFYLSLLAKELLFWGTVIVLSILCIFLVLYIQGRLTSPFLKELAQNAVTTEVKTLRTFSDVQGDTLQGKAIMNLVSRGVLSGYEDGTFRPEKEVSRVEAMKMVFAISDIENNDIFDVYQQFLRQNQEFEYVIFSDIPKNTWFAPYVYKAYRLGMISGNKDGTFNAPVSVTLAEVLKMLLVMEREQFSEEDDVQIPFPGVEAKQWFTRYFNRAKNIGLLPLDTQGEETINPLSTVTRGTLAQILARYEELRSQGRSVLNGHVVVPAEGERKAYLQEEIGQ